MNNRIATFLTALVLSAAWGSALAQDNASNAVTGRVIVKFKAGSQLLAARAVSEKAAMANRAAMLGNRVGLGLAAGPAVSDDAQVVLLDGIDSDQLAQRLAQESDIEYAIPDQRRHAFVAPNDPLYGAGVAGNGPAVGQWYLRPPTAGVPSAMNAEGAWDFTIGSPNVVVAVLDTGVRYDHPDLGANVLPGYDMISDVSMANDGDGRDPDASDPGDWVTRAEISQRGGSLYQCAPTPQDSSWHGTQVAGLIAAVTNNSIGMASVGRNVRVLPVRVLGKCGAFDSDIIAGMRWAAGLSVPGVPANPTPAKVLNMSLGADGGCDAAYQDAVTQITNVNATIVVAAGNDTGHAVSSPGNCSGVIAVGALRHVGTKVGFANLGPEVAISAPGGNCINTAAGSPCLYPIVTTTNTGLTTPVAATYTDSFNPSLGTSFSTPLVSGTIGLMLSVNPNLTPQQIKATLQASARPFPTTGADTSQGPVGQCTVPQFSSSGTPIDQAECYCTTNTCGAGMLDAAAAVRTVAAGGAVEQTVVEFYNATLDHYFITWVPSEIAILDAGTQIRGWTRTGYTFMTFTSPQVGSSPVCRYYIPPALGDSHFFGRGTDECTATGQKFPSFVLEDPQFMHMSVPVAGICPAATSPVYRVFDNRPDVNHRYTTDAAVRTQMVAKGWIAEGDGPDRVVMCAPQ